MGWERCDLGWVLNRVLVVLVMNATLPLQPVKRCPCIRVCSCLYCVCIGIGQKASLINQYTQIVTHFNSMSIGTQAIRHLPLVMQTLHVLLNNSPRDLWCLGLTTLVVTTPGETSPFSHRLVQTARDIHVRELYSALE